MSYLGEQLRKVRESAGLTQEQVAEKAGMLRTNYVKLETKGKAGLELLRRIAEVAELQVDYITLLSWKLIDEAPSEAIRQAAMQLDAKTVGDIAKEELQNEARRRGL